MQILRFNATEKLIEVELERKTRVALEKIPATGSVIELAPEQTRMTLTFDVASSLPGFGAAVARLFAEQVREALRAEHAFTLRDLERAIG